MDILLNYKLLELLKEYESKELLADTIFIEKAVNIILESTGCLGKIKNIVIDQKTILFEEPLFEKDSLYINSGYNLSSVERFFAINDICNAYNLKVLRLVIKVCNEVYLTYKDFSYFIGLNHEFKTPYVDLIGRNADINALDQINNLYNHLSLYDKTAFEHFIKYEVLKALLNGYSYENDELISPVYKFLREYKMHLLADGGYHEWGEQAIYKLSFARENNSMDQNLYQGLPITDEYYTKLASEKDSLKRVLLKL